MLIAWLPVVVAVLGILLWALASQPIPKEAGRILFAAGVLVTLLAAGRHTVELLK